MLIQFEAERIFYHFATLARWRIQYTICLTLRNDVVSRATNIGPREQSNHVFQTHLCAIEQIFIEPIAVYHPLYLYFIKIEIEQAFAAL